MEDDTDDVSISLYSICTSTKMMHLSMYCPTPSGLYGAIVRQTECVKSPNTAPHKPQLQHGDLTWLHILIKSFVCLCLYQMPHSGAIVLCQCPT